MVLPSCISHLSEAKTSKRSDRLLIENLYFVKSTVLGSEEKGGLVTKC